jgi:hypothetical protein
VNTIRILLILLCTATAAAARQSGTVFNIIETSAKQTPCAGGAGFCGINQGYAARSLADAGPKDLNGGDYNQHSTSASDTLLPVDFIYFTLAPGNAGAFLQWRISNTEGLQYFVVERSADGRSFTPLVVVNSQAEQLVYTYKDADVCGSGRKVYYRVKAVEASRAVLSPVRQLKAAAMELSVSPNPASGSTWLQGRTASGGMLNIRLVGSEGQVLLSQKASVPAGAFRIPLSLAGLPAGMYWVQVGGAGSEESIALLKRD